MKRQPKHPPACLHELRRAELFELCLHLITLKYSRPSVKRMRKAALVDLAWRVLRELDDDARVTAAGLTQIYLEERMAKRTREREDRIILAELRRCPQSRVKLRHNTNIPADLLKQRLSWLVGRGYIVHQPDGDYRAERDL